MIKRQILLLAATVLVSALLLAAVLVPIGSPPNGSSDLIVKAPATTPEGMVWVPGGEFLMGSEEPINLQDNNPDRIKRDEFPPHRVELDGFYLDVAPVTNRQFSQFVEATNYVTFAERQLSKIDFAKRGADVSAFPDGVMPAASLCFNPAFDRHQLVTGVPLWENQVWKIVDGADWRHPDGPDSNIDDRMDHPVVHIAWEDAEAYCKWAGKRLPTEAEFEYAARSGGKDVKYPWGDELIPSGKYMANYWQGEFPLERKNEDSFLVTSPVKSFPPNELGLYDIGGNVWEWCSDLYAADYYANSPRRNPQGPAESYDPQQPRQVYRVQRGGSFLCNINNCTGYRTRARGRGDIASSSYHNGFRCALDSKMLKDFQSAQGHIRHSAKPMSPTSDAVSK